MNREKICFHILYISSYTFHYLLRSKKFSEECSAQIGRQEAPFYSHFPDPRGSSRNRDFYSRQSSSMQIRRLFSEGDSGKKSTSSTPPIHTKPTEQQHKKNVPDIQPSKTHKVETQDGETKKQIKGTKIVVNSVVEQNVVNPSENTAAKAIKSQVNLNAIYVYRYIEYIYVTLFIITVTLNFLINLCTKFI